VHQLICGLSRLMKILGWPSGPPPPSQATVRSCRQRTGCLWIRSMAASGRGCQSTSVAVASIASAQVKIELPIYKPRGGKPQFSMLRNNITYLIKHDSLLKPRPHHRLLSRHLTPAPYPSSIRRLQSPHLLRVLYSLHQRRILSSLRVCGRSIGNGDVLDWRRRLWVVGLGVVDAGAV
jgi:hypothetical protein